MWKFCKVIEI
ncbi:hypothetical protein EC900039_2652A, partial [Escherichia coli 90.0039]